MDVEILEACRKELREFPQEILENFLDAISKLRDGLILSMPLARKLSSLGPQIYELRFKDKSGAYRIIYYVKKKDAIYMVYAFKKKAQKTPKKNLDLATKRIKRLK